MDTISASDILGDLSPRLVVRYSVPRRLGSHIPTQIVDIPQQVMEISQKMVTISQELVEFPQRIMEISEQLMDLSQQITNLNSQLLPHLNTLSQGLPTFPLQSPAQLVTDYPPLLPVFRNSLVDPLLDESLYGPQPAGDPPAYRPLEPSYLFPRPNHHFLSKQSVIQFSPPDVALEPPSFTSSLPPPPVSLPPEIPAPISIPRFHEYGDCSESFPLAITKGIVKETGSEEIRSVAVLVSRIGAVEYVPEAGPIQTPIKLKNPCLNCLSLMERIPETVKMLAATGWSQDISWISGNRQTLASEAQRRIAYGICSFDEPSTPTGHCDFLVSAAYGLKQDGIYAVLEAYTVLNTSSLLSPTQKGYLTELWEKIIIPFRENGTVFHLDQENNVDPIIVELSSLEIPVCTIFCALAYILSVVLSPQQVEAQRKLSYLPLMAVLAKWCCVLCPWAYPNVVSVAYSTSSAPETYFLLGTSKPSTQPGANPGPSHSLNMKQMRGFRRIFIEKQFGELPHPCPLRVAAEVGNIVFDVSS